MSGENEPDDILEQETTKASREQPAALADMRHRLRTPLNHIIGYSEMLLEEASERGLETFAADLQKIHAAGKQLLLCLNELLDPAMMERGSVGRVSRTVTSAGPFREAEPDSRPLAAGCGPDFTTAFGHILVVDDNESNRDMLSRRLQHEGYHTCAAENGHDALALLKFHVVDLILLDVMMPEMDGYEVLSHLKADNTWRDIPVIMISALDEIESVVRCIERGAEDYLSKPFDPVLLRARIGACLEKKRLRDQELLYLKDVGRLTSAAAAVEAGKFAAEMLAAIVKRPDELGQLARVFQRMAQEIAAREEQLKQQIQVLRIEIDEVKKSRQVAEITETDYFQELQEKAKVLRRQAKS
jgi:DNA-binding response OmpR family regulator